MRICKEIINVGPDIGAVQSADARICKSVIGVGPSAPSVEVEAEQGGIIYGTSGLISYGTSGVITY